jgi:predicted RNA-binding Zn-ribbon protein involved in translation (DUF1610 family)
MSEYVCPQCGGKEFKITIGVTNPAMAVAAEALPRGVLLKCANPNCYHFTADFTDVPCPSCGEKTLKTTMDKYVAFSLGDVLNGEVKCTSCDWSIKVSSDSEPIPLSSKSGLTESDFKQLYIDLEELGEDLEELEEDIEELGEDLEDS